MDNKAIISFSHTNYCLRSAGTEKFIRSFSENIQRNGYAHLNLFSFYDDKDLMKTKLFGVNYNDQFVGIYKYDDMIWVIDSLLDKYGLKISCIHLQHMLHHDLNMLKRIIVRMKVPVYVMVHDYFMVCPELKLISSNRGYCGLSRPSQEKCHGCDYEKKAIEHFDTIADFLSEMAPWIKSIITPSAYVAKGIMRIFPQFKERIAIRQHLEYDFAATKNEIQGKVRIAFAGGQMSAKGYDQWKELLSEVSKNLYEFYYLGTGKEEIEGVKNVYVSSAEQGDDAMSKALKANGIHVAFLWPNWAETYSYVLYELAENGIYILTNSISGNICDVVEKEGNGKVFKRFDDCVNFLKDPGIVKREINLFRSTGNFHIKNVRTNLTLDDIISDAEKMYTAAGQNKAVSKQRVASLLYRIKYQNKL